MKKWIAVLVTACFLLAPAAAMAKGGKGGGKGPHPSDQAYEKADDNARFKRSGDDSPGKGKDKGKDAQYNENNMKEKKERHREEAKERERNEEHNRERTSSGDQGSMKTKE